MDNKKDNLMNAVQDVQSTVRKSFETFADRMMNDKEFQGHTLMTTIALLISDVQKLKVRVAELERLLKEMKEH